MKDTITSSVGRPVVSAATAENVGAVKTFVVDRSGRRIEQIQVAGRKRSAQLVKWSDLAGFGPDSVMVSSEDAVTESVDERAEEMVRGKTEIVGARILDTDGFEQGTVTDIEFDADTGDVVAAHTAEGVWSADRIRSLGSYALVVEAHDS